MTELEIVGLIIGAIVGVGTLTGVVWAQVIDRPDHAFTVLGVRVRYKKGCMDFLRRLSDTPAGEKDWSPLTKYLWMEWVTKEMGRFVDAGLLRDVVEGFKLLKGLKWNYVPQRPEAPWLTPTVQGEVRRVAALSYPPTHSNVHVLYQGTEGTDGHEMRLQLAYAIMKKRGIHPGTETRRMRWMNDNGVYPYPESSIQAILDVGGR